jgi:hypothetical protein
MRSREFRLLSRAVEGLPSSLRSRSIRCHQAKDLNGRDVAESEGGIPWDVDP